MTDRSGSPTLDAATLRLVLAAQQVELTEHMMYARLARRIDDAHNREVLARIAAQERGHHDLLQRVSGREVRPRRWLLWWYAALARLFGVTFALKLMERGEQAAQVGYDRLRSIDGIDGIIRDEEEHEQQLIDLLHDEPLEYAGSIVLGLNDALVELTGALAGLTLALGSVRLVAVAGLVTGLAASMSMASSEYLASKSGREPGSSKRPLRAAGYTGAAYLVAVALLILPYFLLDHALVALACTLAVAVLIIAAFTFYISVAKSLQFWPRFWEMALISLGVAAVSFAIGWAVRRFLGLDV